MNLEQYKAEASRFKCKLKNLNTSRVFLTDPEEIEAARAQLQNRDQVETWLKETLKLQEGEYTLNVIRTEKGGPLYEINMNGRDVNLMDYKLSEFPDYIQFGEIIGGNFICSYSKLTSTKGFPRTVGLTFDCSFSQIKSLDGMPELVDRDFIWLNSPFTDEEIRSKVKVTCRVFC